MATWTPPRNWQPVWKISINCYENNSYLRIWTTARLNHCHTRNDKCARKLKSRHPVVSPGNTLSSPFTSLGFMQRLSGFYPNCTQYCFVVLVAKLRKGRLQQRCLFNSCQIAWLAIGKTTGCHSQIAPIQIYCVRLFTWTWLPLSCWHECELQIQNVPVEIPTDDIMSLPGQFHDNQLIYRTSLWTGQLRSHLCK